ncbi:hypothetical protein SY88_01850 [Clostridiales bacterium PH28_bin88]|nr:hypothetical protein SY88_01850 [Clostridiales bacterium PH28_bin88]
MPKVWIDDESIIRDFLQKQAVGVLGLAGNGVPYCIPVNFVYHADLNRIYLHSSNTGQKMEVIAENPDVTFLVYEVEKLVTADQPCNFAMRYLSVVVRGQARVLEDPNKKAEVLTMLARKYSNKPGALPTVTPLQADAVAVIEISIDQIHCKRNVDP